MSLLRESAGFGSKPIIYAGWWPMSTEGIFVIHAGGSQTRPYTTPHFHL